MITLTPVPALPELREGDDLAALLAAHAEPGEIVVVAQKAVSKVEGRVRPLAGIRPSREATELARPDKDPRLVQVVLDESARIVRAERGVLICETPHGFICANAGVDLSNAPGEGVAVLLPVDPDASARRLRSRLPGRPGVVISDSFGRPWRLGQVDVAIGAAGVRALDDWRGRADAAGRELNVTQPAAADALAAASDLARAKDSREPVVVVRGVPHLVTEDDGPGAAALRRPPAEDLFRG